MYHIASQAVSLPGGLLTHSGFSAVGCWGPLLTTLSLPSLMLGKAEPAASSMAATSAPVQLSSSSCCSEGTRTS